MPAEGDLSGFPISPTRSRSAASYWLRVALSKGSEHQLMNRKKCGFNTAALGDIQACAKVSDSGHVLQHAVEQHKSHASCKRYESEEIDNQTRYVQRWMYAFTTSEPSKQAALVASSLHAASITKAPLATKGAPCRFTRSCSCS